MLRVAVCDDNAVTREQICRVVSEQAAKTGDCYRVERYADGQALLSAHRDKPFKLLFLDIQMPELDGFETARLVHEQSPNALIVFITSHDMLVYKIFDHHPLYFIRKGNGENLERDIAKAFALMAEQNKQLSLITLELTRSGVRSVMVNEISHIESDAHYLKYYLNGGEILRTRGELRAVGDRMKEFEFIQIHRCYFVNPACINKISLLNNKVFLLNGTILEIGRSFKQQLSDQYADYLGRKKI